MNSPACDPGPHVGAHLDERLVDGLGRDLAPRHVDDVVPGALAQKPDGIGEVEVESRRHRRLASDDGFALLELILDLRSAALDAAKCGVILER